MSLNKFIIFNSLNDKTNTSVVGSVTIEDIIIPDDQIDDLITDLVLTNSNLKFIFNKEISTKNRAGIYASFVPPNRPDNLMQYINERLRINHNFYSFLAEGLLALVFRDIKGYKLTQSVIDVRDTIEDTKSGVDACLYDSTSSAIVLGEAKFYINLKAGLQKIINDFTKENSIVNKLESLKRSSVANVRTKKIIIRQLNCPDVYDINLNDFLNMQIIFAGFVLHENGDYINGDYRNANKLYKNINAKPDDIKKHVESLTKAKISSKYSIILFHLPIKSKSELIFKVIKKAYELLGK